jgi:hypothetical protein
VADQPPVDLVAGVGGQVVHDEVRRLFGRVSRDDTVHKGEELDRTTPGRTVGVCTCPEWTSTAANRFVVPWRK